MTIPESRLDHFVRGLQETASSEGASFSAVIEEGFDIIVILDESGVVRYASPALERQLGRDPDSVVGKTHSEMIREEDSASFDAALREAAQHSGTTLNLLFHASHQNGSSRLLEGVVRHLGKELGVPGVVLNAHDITDRQAVEEQLLLNAMHDGMTSLPNERLFLDRLAHTARRRRKEGLFAVLYAGLDRFDIITDSLGQRAGEELLVLVARQLETCSRGGDTVARVGEQEFALLLDEMRDPSDAIRVTNRIHDRLKRPFPAAGQDVFTSASIGISLSSTGYRESADMLRDAKLAMHRSRSSPGVPYVIFDKAMHERVLARLQMESALRGALEKQEFTLYYQPIISLASGALAGFEALVRWNPPGRAPVVPSEFITTAEETGLIVPLGRWVLHEACRQLHEWQNEFPAARNTTMSVNVSVKQLWQPDFVDTVVQILRDTRLNPHHLRIEITESMVMDFDAALAMLAKLRSTGAHVAIDDFGTGYSSLSYLSRLPIGMLKIDRSFVSRTGDSLSSPEVVKSILALARSLKLGVTAEGIETQVQREQLRDLDCLFGQGYLIGKPMDRALAASFFTSS